MNIAGIETCSYIYGPGARFVIWLQGCSIQCPGCWNKDMWGFDPKIVISKEDVLQQILSKKSHIEGITLLGGEPLDQFEETLWLVQQVFFMGLSVMLYTGYELEELSHLGKKEILKYVDVLIPGKYIEEQRDTQLQWRGSKNQQVYFLSSKYNPSILQEGNYVEVILEESGQIRMLGYPEHQEWQEFFKHEIKN